MMKKPARLGHLLLLSSFVTAVAVAPVRGDESTAASAIKEPEAFSFSSLAGQFDYQGQHFPRNAQPLFRGVHRSEIHPAQAIRALLGDRDVVVGAWMFKRLKLLFTASGLTHQAVDGILKWAKERGLEGEIRDLIATMRGPMTDSQATAKAKELMNRGFSNLKKNQDPRLNAYYDYGGAWINNRRVYNDSPNDAIFSSIFPNYAAGYSPDVVVIQEGTPRSIDLNAFNFRRHGVWYNHSADVGEFLTPGYIDGQDIQGYEMHTRENDRNPIDVAFYRADLNGEPIVLILDGRKKNGEKSPCIVRTAPLEFRFCQVPKRGQATAIAQTPNDEVPRLIGVVRACEPKKECDVPQEFNDKFKLSLLELDPRLLDSLSHEMIDGKEVRVVYAAPRTKGQSPCPRAKEVGLLGEYFRGVSFNERVLQKLDPEIYFDVGSAPFGRGVQTDDFSVSWKGYLVSDQSGTYLLLLTSDDGSRLYLNGDLKIDNWSQHPMETKTATVKLEAGKRYPLQIDFFERGGDQGLRFEWQPPNGQTQVVPKENLRPR